MFGEKVYEEGRFGPHPLSNDFQEFWSLAPKGDFCCGGPANLPAPGLFVEGVGDVAFPLHPTTVQALKDVASQAPYGKGAETIVDIAVRNSLQIDPSIVKMKNPKWNLALQALVESVAEKLGASSKHVEVDFYKVLLYEAGGHFKPHKDTEKVAGMFATLVVQFPCSFSGGSFIVRHRGIERSFLADETDQGAAFEFRYVAHYADCEHEVLEVMAGVRLAAVYSLRWKGTGSPPCPPSIEAQTKLAKQMEKLDGGIGYMLDHHYTTASLARYGLRALKGKDRTIADGLLTASDLLQTAAGGGGLVIHIAKARRVVVDVGDGGDYGPGPRLATSRSDDAFQPDGSPAEEAALTLLQNIRFYDHIVNRKVWKQGDYDNPNDEWWGDSEGAQLGFAGNEGGEGTQTYYSFVLTAWRADGGFNTGRAVPAAKASSPVGEKVSKQDMDTEGSGVNDGSCMEDASDTTSSGAPSQSLEEVDGCDCLKRARISD